jgi:hypothetical protein
MFFFFLLFGPLLFSNLVTFLFFIPFKQFKSAIGAQPEVLQIILNSDSKRATYKVFLGCLGTAFDSVRWFFFCVVLTPFIFMRKFIMSNFLISNPFWMIVTVPDAPRGGIQVLFGHLKQQSPKSYPLKLLKGFY